MIIHDTRPALAPLSWKWVIPSSILVLIIITLWAYLSRPIDPPSIGEFQTFFCDAERISKGYFRTDNLLIPGASQRTSEKAFSGRYAYSFPSGEGLRFGWTTTLKAPQEDIVIKISHDLKITKDEINVLYHI